MNNPIFLAVVFVILGLSLFLVLIRFLSNLRNKKIKEDVEKRSRFFNELVSLNNKYKELHSYQEKSHYYSNKVIDDIVYTAKVGYLKPTSKTYKKAIEDLFTNRRNEILNKFDEKAKLLNLYEKYKDDFNDLVDNAKKNPHIYFATSKYRNGYRNLDKLHLNFRFLRIKEPDFSFYVIVKTDYNYKQNSSYTGKIFNEAEIKQLLEKYNFPTSGSKSKDFYDKTNLNIVNEPFRPNFVINNESNIDNRKASIRKEITRKILDSSLEKNGDSETKKDLVSSKKRQDSPKAIEFKSVYSLFLNYGIDNLFDSCDLFKGFETLEKFDFSRPFFDYSSEDINKDKFVLLFSLITFYEKNSEEVKKRLLHKYGFDYYDFSALVYKTESIESLNKIDEAYCKHNIPSIFKVARYSSEKLKKVKNVIDNTIEYISDYYTVKYLDLNKIVALGEKNYKLSSLLVSDECLYYLDLSFSNISIKSKLQSIYSYYLLRKSEILTKPKNIIILRPFCNQIVTYSGKIIESSFFGRVEDIL